LVLLGALAHAWGVARAIAAGAVLGLGATFKPTLAFALLTLASGSSGWS
jgi:hypothetical protein